MRFRYGLIGAVLGAIVGGAAALLIISISTNGDDFGIVFMGVLYGPVGLAIGAVLGVVAALCVLPFVHGDKAARLAPKKKALLIPGLVIGAPLLSIGLLSWAFSLGGPPSDNQLLSNFARHRSAFEQLARMVQTDKGLQWVDVDWASPSNTSTVGVSPARLAEYRSLLRRAGVPKGFQVGDTPNEIDFYSWVTGSVLSDDTFKGYAYCAKPPVHRLRSLDNYQPGSENVEIAYRHIQGQWYLFYESTPG